MRPMRGWAVCAQHAHGGTNCDYGRAFITAACSWGPGEGLRAALSPGASVCQLGSGAARGAYAPMFQSTWYLVKLPFLAA